MISHTTVEKVNICYCEFDMFFVPGDRWSSFFNFCHILSQIEI